MTHPAAPGAEVDAARLVAAHAAATAFYRRHLLAADGPRRYLNQRGLGMFARPNGVDKPWQLGYAPPGWTTLAEHLTAQGFTPGELVAAGLGIRAGRGGLVDVFRDRILFPVVDHAGEPVAFLGRAAPGVGPDVPKYVNSTDTPIYRKRHTLYGLGQQTQRAAGAAMPTIVEGPTDVLAVWLASPDHLPLATCGTSLTTHHAAIIAALPGARDHGVLTVFDGDPAGRAATLRSWQHLSVHKGLRLDAVLLPAGRDPADLAATGDLPALLAADAPLAQAVIDIHLDQLRANHPEALAYPEGRIHAIRALAGLIVDLPPQQVTHLAAHIADRTGSPLQLVVDIIIERLETDHGGDAVSPHRAAPTSAASALPAHPYGSKPSTDRSPQAVPHPMSSPIGAPSPMLQTPPARPRRSR